MCAAGFFYSQVFFTSLNLPTPAEPSLHSSSHSAGEQALHPPSFHFTLRRHNARVSDYGRWRSPPSPQSRLRPSKMECSSHAISGEIASALTPPHNRFMYSVLYVLILTDAKCDLEPRMEIIPCNHVSVISV